ncbi:MAG: hypothetical protein ACM3KR_10190 [Deltaproteobacteria bacterium]
MKNIEIKKFIIIVTSVVLSFCLVAGIILWTLISKQPPKQINLQADIKVPQNASENNGSTEKDNGGIKQGTQDAYLSSDNVDNNALNQGVINVKNINSLVKTKKYSLLKNGSFDSNKVNNFIDKNIEQFFSANCTNIDYKTTDINNDGVNEVALMYEMSKQSDRYLMIATLRWKDGMFYKDIDEELKKNDYNFNTNEIVIGDVISGGNPEFVFIQKDPQGIKQSKAKIIVILSRGFSDFYTVNSSYELEVKDYDSDGTLELYTSLIASDGNKHMLWKKWNGKEFIEYDSGIEVGAPEE